jgi:hypothetical protein
VHRRSIVRWLTVVVRRVQEFGQQLSMSFRPLRPCQVGTRCGGRGGRIGGSEKGTARALEWMRGIQAKPVDTGYLSDVHRRSIVRWLTVVVRRVQEFGYTFYLAEGTRVQTSTDMGKR